MNSNFFSVILAGGVGSRFWPASTQAHPKQFHDILGTGRTLIQQTFDRVKRICPADNILISTSADYIKEVKTQLPEIPPSNIMAEPARRNTAPAIAYAVYKIFAKNPDASVLICPSDHLILKEAEFERIARLGLSLSQTSDVLLTIGIKPTRPDTGYGYIQYLPGPSIHPEIRKVKTFTEKPSIELAKMFLDSGDFLWNAGIFIWSVNACRKVFEKYLPEIHQSFERGLQYFNTNEEMGYIAKVYPSCENQSVDYGIMEKAENVHVIPADLSWSDLGTWGSLYEHLPWDDCGNAKVGKHIFTYETCKNIIRIEGNKVAVIDGLNDFIIVDTQHALLICRRENEQLIKNFVNEVKIKAGDQFV
ncbi:mannose-1-phosphate guanylyltransferase [Schleiferia thermophila]|uniref:mannose-1-phosphate guanylyltransferase n=1 Tax=Schleiferia thermophila TaxID=884107 RepID=UPI003EEA992B